jgi:hypothetical protein
MIHYHGSLEVLYSDSKLILMSNYATIHLCSPVEAN